MDNLFQDLHFAVRAIKKSPGFTLAVIATLALGIGANTAIFSAVDGVLLRPLPYADAERLVTISSTFRSRDTVTVGGSALPDVDAFREARSLAGLAAAYTEDRNLAVAGSAERVRTAVVSPGLFALLGVAPALGREPAPAESGWGRHRVVVLSHALHQRLFAGDPLAIGRTLRLNGEDHTIVGVARAGFSFPAPRQDLFVPIAFPPGSEYLTRGNHFVEVVARLAPGATVAGARAGIGGIAARVAREVPENQNIGARVASLRDAVSGDLRPGLLVLLGAVGLVLLICCANLANLLLARGSARARELAVRAALGAGRGRLVRQLITESLLLAVAGGAAGVLLGSWLLDGVLALGPASIRLAHHVTVDGRVLAFATALSVATGLGFGLAPALLSTRMSLADALKDGARGSGSRGGRLRQALVVGEIAVAMVLLAGAGLLTRSFAELSRVRLGFDPEGVVAGTVKFADNVEPEARKRFFAETLRRLRDTPGVESAGVSTALPMDGGGWGKYASAVGRPPARLEDVPLVQYRLVGGDGFRALRMAAVAGRVLGPADDAAGARDVVVINQTAARALFGAADPVGQQIIMAPPEAMIPDDIKARLPREIFVPLLVAGVVGDVKSSGPGMPAQPEVFRVLAQAPEPASGAAIVVRGQGDLAAALRRAVAATSAEQPIADVQPLTALLGEALAAARFHTALLGAFAALALLLALVGVYGVMSYTMSQRAHEMGIRLALGATPRAIVVLVLRRGLSWLALGLGLGVAGAFAAARLAASLLFGVTSSDPVAFGGAVAAVLVTALLALLIPARRASRVSPLASLRQA